MSKKLYIFLLMLIGCVSSHLYAQEVWKTVYYNDFGGNSKSDPWAGPAISEVPSSIYYVDAAQDRMYGNDYTVVKHYDNNSDWYIGGDHTNPSDREQGYFVVINPDGAKSDVTAFVTPLKGLCRGVTFRFSAWVANMMLPNKSGSSMIPYVGVGVYESDQPVSLVSPNAYKVEKIPCAEQDINSPSLAWQEVEIEFTMNGNNEEAYFIVVMHQPESNGWDFAIDDIRIEVKQPEVTISHDDIYYEDPLTLTASFDNNGFFSDMNSTQYTWEYSANGNDYETIKTENYSNDKNFSYTIPSFDRTKNNGYYRVTIGERGNMDSEVCSLTKVIQIDEDKDKVKVSLCAGESKTMKDGTVINASQYKTGDVKVSADGKITYYITVKEPKTIKMNDEYICIGTEYNGMCADYKGKVFDDEENISVEIEYKDEDGCLDSVQTWTIRVSGPSVVKRDDKVICQNGEAYGKTYEKAGVFDESVTNPENSCIEYIYQVTVNPVYDRTEVKYLCQGEKFNGKTYNEIGGPFMDAVTYKTKNCGCDSTVGYTIYVTGKTYTDLEDVTLCYGESYSFANESYSTPGIYNLEDVYTNTSTGCDSIVRLKLTILDKIENKDNPIDTLICYDSKLFGVVYPDPTTSPILVRDPQTYVSAAGCDSIVWYNLTVLKIQLKLEVKSDRNTVCRGEEVEIYIKELKPSNVPYQWFPNLGGSNSSKKNFTPTGDMDCVVKAERVIDATSTCVTTDTIHVYVKESPVLEIESVDQRENLVIYSVTGGSEPYKFSLDKKDLGSDNSGEIRESPIGAHKLVVTDVNECSDAGFYEISPIPVTPMEYFTPNNDGENDTWYIENADVYPNCKVTVYDRLGRVVYQSQGYDNAAGWDGTYNGNPLPSTDYWYVINLPESDTQLLGHFTLIR